MFFTRGMNKSWFSRPEILIPSFFVVWFASAAAYAVLFSY
jgi:membrane protein implicated in regulation of membrane protease activity